MGCHRSINKTLKGLSSLLILFVSLSAHAVPFTNGDFSSSAAWNDASGNGSAAVVSGAAQLETGVGGDPFSSVLVQGDDGFFGFTSAISLASNVTTLNFDANFINLGVDATETATSFFTDELYVSLYDAFDFSLDVTLLTGINSSVATGFLAYSFDVSSLAGRDIALSFELSDEDNGFDSRVLIDNVVFNVSQQPPVTVAEPGVLYLLLSGVMLLGFVNAGRKNTGLKDLLG